MFPTGSNPAIMMPAPKAIPATGAVAAPDKPWFVGMRLTPMKVAAELTTSKIPMTHMRIFSARGFHFATTCLPPFFRPRVDLIASIGGRFQVQLIGSLHAISNLLGGKYLRAPQPHHPGLEPVSPREGPFVLGFPEHKVGQLARRDNATVGS